MHHAALLLSGLICLAPCAVAADAAPRMSGDDVAVLEGVIHADCTDASRRPILVADAPENAPQTELPDEGGLEKTYGAALRARNTEHSRWPPTSLCEKVRVESMERIRGFFAKDKRIPAGWKDSTRNSAPVRTSRSHGPPIRPIASTRWSASVPTAASCAATGTWWNS